MENKELTIALSENAINRIQAFRECEKAGESFDKIMFKILEEITCERGYSENDNMFIRHITDELIYYRGLLNSLLDDDCNMEEV